MASALFDAPPSRAEITAALYYGLSTMGAQFMNKALFAYHGFDAPWLIALAQMALLAPACAAAAGLKKWCPSTARAAAPLAALNAAGVVTALAGTGALSVPLFITLRRLSAAASMTADRIALGKAPPRGAVLSSGVMAAGAALAALTEARGPGLAFGSAAVLANCGLTAWYLARLRQRAPPPGLSAAGLLAYTSALAVPFLAAAAVVSGEASGAWRMATASSSSSNRHSSGERESGGGGGGTGRESVLSFSSASLATSPSAVALALLASALLGGCVHHATYVSSRAGPGGPSLAAKAGAAKNVLMMLVGAVAFGDYAFSWPNAAGHLASTAGALWFGADAAARARAKRGQQATPLVRRDPSGVPLIGRDRLGRLDAARRAREAAANAATAAAARGENGSSPAASGSSSPQQQVQQQPPRSPELQQQPGVSTASMRGSPSPARTAAGGSGTNNNNNNNGASSSTSTPPPPPPVRGDDSRV